MDKEQVLKQALKRESLVTGLEKHLDSLVLKYQAKLLDTVSNIVDEFSTDEQDKLVNSSANYSVINTLDKELDKSDGEAKAAIIKNLVDSFNKIVTFNGSYFQEIDSRDIKPVSTSVMDSLKGWLGIDKNNQLRKNGYLDTLVKSTTVKNAIKETVVRSVAAGQGWKATKDNVKQLISGGGDSLGAMQKYYRNFTYDTFAQVDRKASQDFSNKLGYRFAIYAGGLIKTSRKFCIKHNGNVYHTSEIEKFKPQVAVPPNYDPFADLGGYGCRHSLNWIPDSLAVRLRPDAAKFIKEDEPGSPEPPKPTEPQNPEEPKKPVEPKPDPVKTPGATAINPPTVSTAIYNDTSANYKGITHTKTREAVKKLFPEAAAVSVGSKVPKENLPKLMSALQYLRDNYKMGGDSAEKIVFTGGNGYAGVVSRYSLSGKIAKIDFGSVSSSEYTKRGRIFRDVLEQNLARTSSSVDPENLDISTVVHEWAHVLATTESYRYVQAVNGVNALQFFRDLGEIREAYKSELQSLTLSGKKGEAGAIFLGSYANTNLNEFMAEAFTEYTLKSGPSKYAIKVGKLIDKYFKK